jgi:hypothetical protein
MVVAMALWLPAPAASQSWTVQLRYWPSSVTGNYGGIVVPYNTYFWGLSLRAPLANDKWAVSFNFDRGDTTIPGFGSGQYSQFWNLNLHRNFPLPNGVFSVYAGWGSLTYEAPNIPGFPLSQQQQGLRVGLDARINLANNWYVTGDFGYGPSGSAQFTNTFVAGTVTVQARSHDARLGVGRTFGPWGLEVGYRWLLWAYTPGPNACATSPCEDRWNGWYLGLNLFRR